MICPYCPGELGDDQDVTGTIGRARPSDQRLYQCGACSGFSIFRRRKVWPLAVRSDPDASIVPRVRD